MKKLITLALTGVMAISMVACGSKEEKAANRLEKIMEAGKIVVATSPDWAPYEFENPNAEGQDKYVGSDMELARYIAEKMGVELEISAMDFDACIAAVGEGRVDLTIIDMAPTEERGLLMDFTDTYYDDASQNIVIRKEDAEKFTSLADFTADTKVAAQNGSLQYTLVTEQTGATIETIAKATDGILMLQTGKIDGVAVAGFVANTFVEKNDDLTLLPEGLIYDTAGVSCGVPKGEEELLAKLNEIIAEVVEQGLYFQWMEDATALVNELGIQ